jgi:hypothetical protein
MAQNEKSEQENLLAHEDIEYFYSSMKEESS